MNEDDLKRHWQAGTANIAGPHLDDETLLALSSGQIADARRGDAVDHVSNCRDCATAVQALMQARRDLMSVRTPPTSIALHRMAGLKIAAAIVFGALALGAWWSVRQAPQIVPVLRSDSAAVIQLTAEGQTLPRAEFTLTWESPPGARNASVTLFAADTTVVYRNDHLTGNSVTVPLEPLKKVADGTPLFWTVEVTIGDGRVLSSGSRMVRVR